MPDVVIIGAGPAGLTLARDLRTLGAGDVVVLDRDDEPGGVPRHSHHPGYGLRDLHRSLSGPAYARQLTDAAITAGADVRTRATVTGLRPGDGTVAVDVTSPEGRTTLAARAVAIATGCRERPRSARLVPGTRPAGVLTTGWLQRAVYGGSQHVGTRAVVVGAEHVSYSAVMTLAHAGCRTVAMVTDKPSHTSYAAFDLGARMRYRFPLLTRTSVTDILGRERVHAVEVTDHVTGERSVIECDAVVFTGDWIAENELPRRLGLAMNTSTTGPVVDGRFRTSHAGVFAVGNVLHPASTADRCALDGRAAAASVAAWAGAGAAAWPTRAVGITVTGAGRWAVPTAITADGSDADLLVEVIRPVTRPRVTVTQGDRELWSGRIPWAVPTRPVPIPDGWRTQVDPAGPEVRISIA
jgi:thioredoxin reductase